MLQTIHESASNLTSTIEATTRQLDAVGRDLPAAVADLERAAAEAKQRLAAAAAAVKSTLAMLAADINAILADLGAALEVPGDLGYESQIPTPAPPIDGIVHELADGTIITVPHDSTPAADDVPRFDVPAPPITPEVEATLNVIKEELHAWSTGEGVEEVVIHSDASGEVELLGVAAAGSEVPASSNGRAKRRRGR